MKNTLLIYSGGMDSTVALAEYNEQIKQIVYFNYGAKNNEREIDYVVENCKRYGGKEFKIIDLDFNKLGIKNVLLTDSNLSIPERTYKEERITLTIVPFRNAIFLSIATSLAECQGLDSVMIATHKEINGIFPDCSYSFSCAMDSCMRLGTQKHIELLYPYAKKLKREIAIIGLDLHVNFNYTWTCLNGQKIHCGRCGPCNDRKLALEGFDTTTYRFSDMLKSKEKNV